MTVRTHRLRCRPSCAEFARLLSSGQPLQETHGSRLFSCRAHDCDNVFLLRKPGILLPLHVFVAICYRGSSAEPPNPVQQCGQGNVVWQFALNLFLLTCGVSCSSGAWLPSEMP